MAGFLVRVLQALVIVGCVALWLALLVTWVIQAHLTGKVQRLSRKLGGDPPRLWFSSGDIPRPKFWEYVRAQCRKPGTEELRALVRKADVVLTVRAVLIITTIAAAVVVVAVKGC